MIKNILFFIFFIISISTFSQSVSPDTEISLLTCTSGNDLYSTFGHSALRFNGIINGRKVDIVYNYGTFEFGSGFWGELNFYYKFAKGQLDYKLADQSFASFEYEYKLSNRGITEQILNLSPEEKNELFAFMVENIKLENCYYRYDFFYDNCSTRIRDVLKSVLDYKMKYEVLTNDTTTFRHQIQLYLNDMYWSDFGIDIALGLPCDKVQKGGEDMFLPDFLMANFEAADKEGQPLVLSTEIILAKGPQLEIEKSLTPSKLLWILLIITIVVTIASHLTHKKLSWYYNLFFIITGILGLLVFFLWFMTDHSTTKFNLNILWLTPLNLLVPIFWKKKWITTYLKIYGAILLLLLISFNWFPQEFHSAFIPFMLILLISSAKKIGFTNFLKPSVSGYE